MIRLAVIGYGGRAEGMVKLLESQDANVSVVAAIDPNEKSVRARLPEKDAKAARFYKDVKTLVRDAKPDALFVGTRCNLHTPYAIEISKLNLPLFLEKPVAISMRQAIDLERAFEKSKSKTVVSFPLRLSPLCVLTRSRIEEGAIGRPEHILGTNYVNYGTCYFDSAYRNYPVTQGLFLQKATHDFDYMSVLMGSPIVRVAAMALKGRVFGGKKASGLKCSDCKEVKPCPESPENRKFNSSSAYFDFLCPFSVDVGTKEKGMNEDCSSALIEFASGAQGVYTQVFFSRRDAGSRGATVSGYDGTVSFDWYTNQAKFVRHHKPYTDVSSVQSGLSHGGGDDELCRDFLRIIKGTGKSRSPIEAGLRSAYSCLAAKESSEKGKFVRVRQLGE